MTFRGHIKNGQIVADSGVTLPEGTKIEYRPVKRPKKAAIGRAKTRKAAKPRTSRPTRKKAKARTLYDTLKPFIGMADGLPADASINLDHYLYGHPKRS